MRFLFRPVPQRNTRQRALIEAVLHASDRPLTRQEIHALARQSQPRIGFATVSRAVNDLLDSGQVVRLQYPGQPDRYEKASAREHPHLLCNHCAKIFDLPLAMPKVNLPRAEGYTLNGYEVLFFGECRKPATCPHRK